MVKHRLYITDIYHLHAEQSSGLPQGQEKLKKMTKVSKKCFFFLNVEFFRFKLTIVFYLLKPSNG